MLCFNLILNGLIKIFISHKEQKRSLFGKDNKPSFPRILEITDFLFVLFERYAKGSSFDKGAKKSILRNSCELTQRLTEVNKFPLINLCAEM